MRNSNSDIIVNSTLTIQKVLLHISKIERRTILCRIFQGLTNVTMPEDFIEQLP